MPDISFTIIYMLLVSVTCVFITRFTIPGAAMIEILRTSGKMIIHYGLRVFPFLILLVALLSWAEIHLSTVLADSCAFFRKDFTHVFLSLEKDVIYRFQQLRSLPLTIIFSYLYIVVWPSLLISSIIIYSYYRDRETLRFLTKGYLLSFCTVLPFYFLFPVKESWAGGAGTVLLLNDITPRLEQSLRPLSGIDNCFPSFHVLLAFTVAFIPLLKGYYRMGSLLVLLAFLISLSTLYLGIHWVTDVLAGMIFAVIINMAIVLSEKGGFRETRLIRQKEEA